VWLPLALAHIYQTLVFIATAYAKPEANMKAPTIAEALAAFALPAMSEAARREERESSDRNFVASLKSLAARTGGKVEVVRK